MRSDIISGPTERANALPALTPVTCKEATLADANLLAKRAKKNAEIKAWKLAHPERVREYGRRSYAKMKPEQKARKATKAKAQYLKRRFGLTPEDWQRMYDAQGGLCAICQIPGRVGRHGKLQVDHCHDTGRIRGLLCGPCNVALGIFGDTPDSLARVLRYVRGDADV